MIDHNRPVNVDLDSSRREFLGELGIAFAASLIPASLVLAGDEVPAVSDQAYPADDVRRYGIVPNQAAAATVNTVALAALVSPAGGFSGSLTFPNTTGEDVYYFNDMIPFHDGVHIDLMNSTLNFSKIGVARDTNAGFFHAIRDFSIENGSIVVDYTHKAGFNTGNALSFGGRGSDCALFPNLYDSLLPLSMGKIIVRNIQISSNASGGVARGILLLGGLDGVLIENVTIDGQKQLLNGIYYEFGWATNESKPYLRQTSHAHNFHVKNLKVSGVIGEALGANGLYRAVIDGLSVTDAGSVCLFGPGESLFFRVWPGVGDRKSKPNIVIRNVVGESISTLGIGITGAAKMSASYLDNLPSHDNPNGLTAAHQTDLIDFTLDTFTITGTIKNYGVSTSAGRAIIRNGTITGFQRGIVTTQECTKFVIDTVKVLDSTGLGMQIGQGVTLHTPPRLTTGIVRHCIVAGSGTESPSAAIAIGTTQSCVIEGCRFGYDESRDSKDERTQTQAVAASADTFEVICRNNYVLGSVDNAVAYTLAGPASPARQCRLVNNGGSVTASGPWLTARQGPGVQVIGNGGTIATAGMHSVWVAASGAVTGVGVQAGTQQGQTIVVIHNGPPANTIGFGVAAASHVQDGAQPIVGLTSRILVWNDESKLWNSFN
jgi:hypothetical protein